MHNTARAACNFFGPLVFLGCVLASPTAAGAIVDTEPAVAAADDAELVRLSDEAKNNFRAQFEPSLSSRPVSRQPSFSPHSAEDSSSYDDRFGTSSGVTRRAASSSVRAEADRLGKAPAV